MASMLPSEAYLHLAPDLRICRVLNGMWQVSGAHGPIDPDAAIRAMFAHHDAGFTTWDLADHYGPAEDFIGRFRRELAAQRGNAALSGVTAFTKWVPRPWPMTAGVVRQAIERSLRRMDASTLDLLQFHWWVYEDPAYLDALQHLERLRDEGMIRHLALTNFDTEHLERIARDGIAIVSNQVQYSLIDRRPEVRMAPYCREHGIRLLAYGSLCGGLLTERYLGRPEPRRGDLATASQQKYKGMIDAWGGWGLFQELLQAVAGVARRHGVSMGAVAVRYLLQKPAVAGVIAGVRLGVSEHIAENSSVFGFSLDADAMAELDAVSSRGRDLFQVIGDCGAEYR